MNSFKNLVTKVYGKIREGVTKTYDKIKDFSHKANHVFHEIDRYVDIARSVPVVSAVLDVAQRVPVGRDIASLYSASRGVIRQINNVLQPPDLLVD